VSDIQLSISQEQRDLLVHLLTAALKEKRVEVHRTEVSRDFRHQLEAEESAMAHLLDKLSHTAAGSPLP
jgi:hypothetical protein